MQAGIFALVVIDVDRDFLHEMQRLALWCFDALDVGRKDIVGFSGGNALGEFAMMVGVDFPTNFLLFVGRAADVYSHAINGMIVGAPDSSKDDRVGLVFLALRSRGVEAQIEREKKDCDRQKLDG
jgi:hypothetical protein